MSNREIVIIGAGAAGMMAAVTAAEKGAAVTLVERNARPGRKLLITGKGRCNLTNNCSWKEILANVPQNSRFLYSSVSRFTPADVMAFFEALGVPLKTERGARVFPVSDRSVDVVDALDKRMRQLGIKRMEGRVLDIMTQNGRAAGVKTDRGQIPAGAVLIATGGLSYPATGSDGDGYAMAKALGHTVTPLSPSLVPLESPDDFCPQMQGLALKNVGVKVFGSGPKPLFEDFGELLFTHFGVSGPTVLSASAHMRHFGTERYRLCIDLKPALDEKTLDQRLLRDFQKYANRSFENALGDLYSRTMIPVMVSRSGIDPQMKVHSITKAQRRSLLELTKCFSVAITGPRPIAEAVVTSGGVAVSEVDPGTMQSKLCPGLYFAGEVLDVDAYTGGFNLQIAWSTGRAAGEAMSEWIAQVP